jgi:hypothetical protein
MERALIIPFLAIHAKGGESKSPKQKDRTTTNFKTYFGIDILLVTKFQIGIPYSKLIPKPS